MQVYYELASALHLKVLQNFLFENLWQKVRRLFTWAHQIRILLFRRWHRVNKICYSLLHTTWTGKVLNFHKFEQAPKKFEICWKCGSSVIEPRKPKDLLHPNIYCFHVELKKDSWVHVHTYRYVIPNPTNFY